MLFGLYIVVNSIQLLLQGVKSLKKGQSFTDPNITKFRSIYSLNRKKY